MDFIICQKYTKGINKTLLKCLLILNLVRGIYENIFRINKNNLDTLTQFMIFNRYFLFKFRKLQPCGAYLYLLQIFFEIFFTKSTVSFLLMLYVFICNTLKII